MPNPWGGRATAPRSRAAELRRTLRRRLFPRSEYLARLEAVPLFQGLSKRELAVLARRADPMRFCRGDVLAREDDPRPQFVVIADGAAVATLRGERMAVLGPGDHFGELALLPGEPYVPTVRALTDVELLVVGRREFSGLLRAVPTLSLRLVARLGEGVRRAELRLVCRHRRCGGRRDRREARR